MRYSLKSLIIVMLLGGPALAGLWWVVQAGVREVSSGNEKPLHALAAVGFVALMLGLLLSLRKRSQE